MEPGKPFYKHQANAVPCQHKLSRDCNVIDFSLPKLTAGGLREILLAMTFSTREVT